MEMQFIGLVVSLIGGILDPLTLGTAIIVGTLSPSKYWTGGLGLLVGVALATMAASVSTTLNTHYTLVDGWLLQVSNSFILSGGVYFLKRGWKKLGKIQREMDEEQAYLVEMQKPGTMPSDDATQRESVKDQSREKAADSPVTTKKTETARPFQFTQWLSLLSITMNIVLIAFCFLMYKKIESIELQTSGLLDRSSLESIETKLADVNRSLDALAEESRNARRTSESVTIPYSWGGHY